MKVEELKLLDDDLVYYSDAELRKNRSYAHNWCVSIPVRDIYSRNTYRYAFSVSQFCKNYVLTPNILQRVVLLFRGKVVFKNKLTGIVKYHDGKLYKVRNVR